MMVVHPIIGQSEVKDKAGLNKTAVSYTECDLVKVWRRYVFILLLVADFSGVACHILKVLSQPNNIKNEWYMLLGLSQKCLPSWPQCNHLSLSPDLWEPRALLFLCHLIPTAASSQPISAASIPAPSVTVISFLIRANVCKWKSFQSTEWIISVDWM